jgi:hypothetical protein
MDAGVSGCAKQGLLQGWMIEGKRRKPMRERGGQIAIGSEAIQPARLTRPCRFELLAKTQANGFGNPPRTQVFPPHAVPELLLALQHQYSKATRSHDFRQRRSTDPAPDGD